VVRTETSQARYTNRQLDPYPLYGLAELFDTIGREVGTGKLDLRNPIRQSAVVLASGFVESSISRRVNNDQWSAG